MCWGPKEADVIGKIERTLKWREEVSFKKNVPLKMFSILGQNW